MMKHSIRMGAVVTAVAASCMGQTTAPRPEGILLSPSTVVENLDRPRETNVELLQFSPNGKEILFTRATPDLKIADASTGKILYHMNIAEFFNSLTISTNGKLVACGTNKGKVHILDATKLTPLKEFQIGNWSVDAVALSPDGRLLAADTGEGPVLLWDVEKGRQITELAEKNGDRSADLRFSPDGKLLAAYSCAGRLQIWETTGGKRPDDMTAMVQGLSSEDFATREAAQNQLDAMGADQLALLEETEKTTVDAETKARLARRRRFIEKGFQWSSPQTGGNNRLQFLPDAKTVALLAEGIRLCPYSSHDGGTELPQVTYPDFMPPGMDLQLLQLQARMRGDSAVHVVPMQDVLSADGLTAASFYNNGIIAVWEVKTAKVRYTLTGKRNNQLAGGGARELAITADGKRVACGMDDGTVELWDLANQAANP